VTPEGDRLDRHLRQTIAELSAKGLATMPPITSAKASMLSVKDLMKPVHDAMEEFRGGLQAKVEQMANDVRQHGAMVIKKVEDEHREMKQDFAEMLGNEHPSQKDDIEGKPQGS
jgi:protoporphyrinogen oxidase